MDKYIIKGGKRLFGEIEAGGNKNAALPCIAAALLTEQQVTLHRIPEIEDVSVMFSLITDLGAQVERLEQGTYRISRKDLGSSIKKIYADAIRASILLVPALLAANRKIVLPPPGGDVIGHRRLDTHFQVFQSFGAAAWIDEEGNISAHLKDRLIESNLFLEEASVTATENAIMFAAVTTGKTVITNAACEPHVQDLCTMLEKMGAEITGKGSNVLYVEGNAELKGCEMFIGADYMEVGSYIGLAGSAGGNITINKANPWHLKPLLQGFRRLEIDWEVSNDSVTVCCEKKQTIKLDIGGHIPKIDDAPWPGFPSDLLSIITVAATQSHGTVLIHEKMFESRLYFIDTLIRMGAKIILCDPHRAVVTGPCRLRGQVMASPDVRAGMALVIAALSAQGESEIQNIYQIERGYDSLCTKLQSIGADIERV